MKRKNWMAALIVTGVLAVALSAGAAFAHEEAATSDGLWDMESYCPGYEEMEEIMSGWGTSSHHMGLNDPVTLERVADTLNLTYDELTARLDQGETIAQVAQTEGIDTAQVVATVLAPRSDVLQVFADYGYLDKPQAQAILGQAKERVEEAITHPLTSFSADGHDTDHEWGDHDDHGMMGSGMMGSGVMGGDMMGSGMMGGW